MSSPRQTLVRAGRVARNAIKDLRHGAPLIANHLRRGTSYSNSDYRALDEIFRGQIRPDDVLVDVGCGVGRVLNWWLQNAPGHRIIGVEFDAEAAAAARKRLSKHQNVTVLTGDASEVIPEDGTLFFLFNSFFGLNTWQAFCDRLVETRRGDTRLRVLCHNCVQLDVFRESGAWDIEVVELGGDPVPFGRMAVISMRANV